MPVATPFESRILRLDDATLQAVTTTLDAFPGEPLHRSTVDDARAGLEARRRSRAANAQTAVAIDAAEDLTGWGGLAVRTYRPPDVREDALILYCHGGAFVMGRPSDFDDICRQLALKTGMRVISVDYRLAPEHPYPAAVTDVMAVLNAASVSHIGIVGESAGGALALASALMERGKGSAKLKAMLLFYPLVSRPNLSASVLDTPLLSAGDVEWAWRAYLGSEPSDGYAVPGEAADFRALPPTLLVHGSRDVLTASVSELAQAMADARCAVEERIYEGLPHAFTALRSLRAVEDILDDCAVWLANAMTRPPLILDFENDLGQ